MAIFKQPPIQWGFLGDSYLWRELAQYFSSKDMPPERHRFEAAIIGAVWVLTGHRLDREEQFKVNRYNKGGISGGIVSCRFWLETAIPLLWQRQAQLKPRKFWQFGKK